MPQLVTIPLGGRDYAGQPLPPQTSYVVADAGGGSLGNWEPYQPPPPGAAAVQPGQVGQPGQGALGNWEPYQAPAQGEPVQPERQIGGNEAVIRGLAHGASFGFAPAIAGLSAASGMALPQETPEGALDQPAGMALLRPFVGAYKMATEGGDRVKAYNEAREAALKEYEQTRAQHPYLTAGGEIAGGLLATPGLGPLGSLKAATTLGRIAQGAKVGATAGGLTGAGEATSRGEAPVEVAKQAGAGAASGAALGTIFGGAIEGVTGTAAKIASLRRGKFDPELEAAKKVQEMFRGPGKQAYEKVRADVPALQAGSEAGAPMTLADFGGRPAGALLRAATDISPEARELADAQLGGRYRQQAPRVIEWIHSKFGGHDVEGTTQALKTQARVENKPAYQRAQIQADRLHPGGIWSPKLEQLMASEAVPTAMQAAIQKGSNRSVAEGLGAFNPRVTFQSGRLFIDRGRGAQNAFPDLQLWDYTQRALRDAGKAAQRQGRDDEASALFALHSNLIGELDHLVPAFGAARGTAAKFFRANDALEAGQNFVGAAGISDGAAMRAIHKMSPAERKLFAQGFASELAERLGARNYSADVLNNMFVNSPRAIRRIQVALGPQAAGEFEALMRIEGIMDRTRRAIGGSQTSTNLQGLPMISGAIASAGEFIHSFNPAYVIGGALALGSRRAAQAIDEQVALRIAQMLMSDNPATIRRGYEIVSRNPVMREALRRASDLGTRELISRAGPYNVGAGLLAAGARVTGTGRPPQVETHPSPYYHEEEQSGPTPLK